MKQWFKEFVHKYIAHPLMVVLPKSYGNMIHDWTYEWAWGNEYPINLNDK